MSKMCLIVGNKFHLTVNFLNSLHTDTTVVFLGSVMLQRYGWHYEVQKIRIHPQWDNATGVNDISMIKLKKKLKWRRTVNRVHLPFNITVYLGSWAVVTGWGSTSVGKSFFENALAKN